MDGVARRVADRAQGQDRQAVEVNQDELAELLKQTLSTHTFAHTTPTRDALVTALWPQLAEVWREGRAAGLQNWLAPNPYEPGPVDPLDRLCECNHRMGDHNQGRCRSRQQLSPRD